MSYQDELRAARAKRDERERQANMKTCDAHAPARVEYPGERCPFCAPPTNGDATVPQGAVASEAVPQLAAAVMQIGWAILDLSQFGPIIPTATAMNPKARNAVEVLNSGLATAVAATRHRKSGIVLGG